MCATQQICSLLLLIPSVPGQSENRIKLRPKHKLTATCLKRPDHSKRISRHNQSHESDQIMNNNINITYKLSRPSKSALVTYNSLNEDREERREVIEILKSVAASYGYTQTIEQWHALVFLKPGSALEQALQPAGLILRDMIAHPAFKRLMKTLHPVSYTHLTLPTSDLV